MQLIASATILFAVVLTASGREIQNDLDWRIIGGSSAPAGKFPYQVSLRVYNEHFCGGSILNKRWILTAARCIVGKEANQISVASGTVVLAESGQLYQAVRIIPHPKYDTKTRVNDIALIRVSRDIVFTNKIQKIDLPKSDLKPVDYAAILTGWGVTSEGGSLAQNLQEIELKVIDNKECAQKHVLLKDSQICTLTRRGKGACHGDIGGPLTLDGVQIGVASIFGESCAVGIPELFTRVWTFVDWIQKTIEANTPEPLKLTQIN